MIRASPVPPPDGAYGCQILLRHLWDGAEIMLSGETKELIS
jgi:hypothetical protein